MAYQQYPPFNHHYGSGRANGSRNNTGSHSATYTRSESTRARSSATTANTSQRRQAGAAGHAYRQNHYHGGSELDEDAHNYSSRQHGQHTASREQQNYHEVYRSWQSHNPEVDHVLADRTLHEAIDRLEGRSGRHNRSSSRQPRPTTAHRRHSPDQYFSNSRPLGYSNLRHLNETRSPQTSMQRRLREDQRHGPYDAVHSVGRRSDYDRRGRHESQQQYQDEEYDSCDD